MDLADHAQRTAERAQWRYDRMEPPEAVGDEQDDDVGSVEWDDDDVSFPPRAGGVTRVEAPPRPFLPR